MPFSTRRISRAYLIKAGIAALDALLVVVALYYTRSYHFIWKYASVNDLMRVLKAILGGMALLAVVNYFRNYPVGLLLAVTSSSRRWCTAASGSSCRACSTSDCSS